MNLRYTSLFALLILLLSSCSPVEEITVDKKIQTVKKSVTEKIDSLKNSLNFPKSAKLEKSIIDTSEKKVILQFSRELSFIPFRSSNVDSIYKSVKALYGFEFDDYDFSVQTMGFPIEELIPNNFRNDTTAIDLNRVPKINTNKTPIVQNVSKKYKISKGLDGRNILLWHSHGWYYNNNEKKMDVAACKIISDGRRFRSACIYNPIHNPYA